MDMGYGAADLIVSRAGSMTCTELLVTGKPAILVTTFASFMVSSIFELLKACQIASVY